MVKRNITRQFFDFMKTALDRPVSRAPRTSDAAGTSGTEIFSGYFDEEYLTKLLNTEGIKVFDQMRRSDGQVAMLLRVVKNPIKSARHWIEPASDEDEHVEHAEFIKHVLFEDMGYPDGTKRKSFLTFVTEALTFVEFGFSVFEMVHKSVKNHPVWGDYLGIKDLGFRHQRSIIEWDLHENGGIKSVRQMVDGDLMVDVLIPGQHLLVFSIEKEGDNYEGISMLRACYGSYFRKNIYRKLQAIGIERASRGVPVGTMPIEMLERDDWEDQRQSFQKVIDKISGHEMNGIVTGPGYELTELKIQHDADKVQQVIASENVEMSKAFLANFMELGLEQNGGSYSLGSDLSDIFLAGIECVGNLIEEPLNNDLIKPLIDAKFGPQEKYPKMKFKGINDKAGTETAEVLTSLEREGLIQKSEKVKAHIHQLYNLPDFDPDIEEELEEKRREAKQTIPNNPDDDGNPKDKHKKKLNNPCDHAILLTDDERKEHPISANIEDAATALVKIMRPGLRTRADQMLSEITKIVKAGGKNVRSEVEKVRMPDSDVYNNQLRDWTGTTADKAFKDALDEVGKTESQAKLDDFSELPKETRDRLISLVLLTAGTQDVDIQKIVQFTFVNNFDLVDDAATIEQMEKAVDRYFDKKLIETAATNMSSNVTNTSRTDVFFADGVLDDVESFIFTNPAPVSLICQSLNGRVFSKEEYETTTNIPPLHHNCKSYIVAQTVGVEGNKSLTKGGLGVTDPKVLRTKTL